MALSLPAVRRIPLALATVVGLLLTTGFASARHVKMPGDLVASPSFVNLGNVGAGINTEVDITITNNTSTALATWTVQISRNGFTLSLEA